MVLAIIAESVIGVLLIFYTLVGVILFVPVVAGLHVRRTGPAEAFAAFAGGLVITLVVRVATDGAGIGFVTPNLAGLGAAGLAFVVALALRRAAPASA